MFGTKSNQKNHLLKMDLVTVYYYFNNAVDQEKTNQLNSITIAKSMQYFFSGVSTHENFRCFCFSCILLLLLLLLVETLIDRGHEKLLDILSRYTYLGVSNNLMNTFFV